MRFFNTAGPVNCKDHYCIPPLERFDLSEILFLIEQRKYFVLHAPRQTGKTSSLLALMDYLNHGGKYACLYINVEAAQGARENVGRGVRAILNELGSRARIYLKDDFPDNIWPDTLERSGEDAALNEVLTQWAQQCSKPLILLIDEIDSLVGDTLISVLRQIRSGYDKRPDHFPHSLILCGVRDVRDYRIHSGREKAVITGGSAFNIKAESLRLGDLTEEETYRLYRQHTDETGQTFDSEALELVWQYTRGQPWIVNALGYEVCFKMKENRNRSRPICAEKITEAKENLILRRETHLDQLVDKLQEERVQRVIEPVLAGTTTVGKIRKDDAEYVRDLGLIRIAPNGEIFLSNPIYQEIIPRELSWILQIRLSEKSEWYITADGRLDMNELLVAFQEFFREHSEHWIERFQYKEAGPQLLLQAFLQRIVNAGGRIEREYGLGRKRTDLLVIWPRDQRLQKIVVELKILYASLEKTIAEGLIQTAAYMDRCGSTEGHLVIFDRSENKSWEEKIFRREESFEEKKIVVWGM